MKLWQKAGKLRERACGGGSSVKFQTETLPKATDYDPKIGRAEASPRLIPRLPPSPSQLGGNLGGNGTAPQTKKFCCWADLAHAVGRRESLAPTEGSPLGRCSIQVT
jgi:hypothetical protein